jgi:hypothetical protein
VNELEGTQNIKLKEKKSARLVTVTGRGKGRHEVDYYKFESH